jgi:ABC-type nitrate/sulfonate/bicarbonate transport system substrate-binding protein
MAHELGRFAEYGLDVKLQREIGWATVRDKLIYGELDAVQAPAGLLVAAHCGLGCVQTPCLTGMVINLNGNAITLSNALWRRGVRDGHTLRDEIARSGAPCTLGVVHLYSSHSILLRKWLRKHGIDPERDVHIVVVPPAQVAGNLRAGHLDGYCVGEPWNSVAVLNGTGWCAATSPDLASYHPEKVLMVRQAFEERSPDEHRRLIAALLEACRFCDQPENRERVVETLAQSKYVNAPIQSLQMSMGGSFDFGHGRKEKCGELHVFHRHDANEPSADKADWVIRGLLDTGLVPDPTFIPADTAAECFRSDIFHQATQSLTANQ